MFTTNYGEKYHPVSGAEIQTYNILKWVSSYDH